MCDLTLPLVFKLFALVDYMKEKGNLKMMNQELQTNSQKKRQSVKRFLSFLGSFDGALNHFYFESGELETATSFANLSSPVLCLSLPSNMTNTPGVSQLDDEDKTPETVHM